MNTFNEEIFKEVTYNGSSRNGNILNSDEIEIVGSRKITIEDESHEGVKIVLNKTVLLDYSEE